MSSFMDEYQISSTWFAGKLIIVIIVFMHGSLPATYFRVFGLPLLTNICRTTELFSVASPARLQVPPSPPPSSLPFRASCLLKCITPLILRKSQFSVNLPPQGTPPRKNLEVPRSPQKKPPKAPPPASQPANQPSNQPTSLSGCQPALSHLVLCCS